MGCEGEEEEVCVNLGDDPKNLLSRLSFSPSCLYCTWWLPLCAEYQRTKATMRRITTITLITRQVSSVLITAAKMEKGGGYGGGGGGGSLGRRKEKTK